MVSRLARMAVSGSERRFTVAAVPMADRTISSSLLNEKTMMIVGGIFPEIVLAMLKGWGWTGADTGFLKGGGGGGGGPCNC